MNEVEDFILEIHYGTSFPALSVETRNACSNSLIFLINEISKSFNSSECFEMMFLPAEEGCYKDLIKIISNKKNIKSVGKAIKVISFLLFLLQIPDAVQKIRLQNIEIEKASFEVSTQKTDKCIEWYEKLENLKKQGLDIEFLNDDLNNICGNNSINRGVNRFYNKLNKNTDISNHEFLFKSNNGKTIEKIKVERKDFNKFITNDDEIYEGHFNDIHFEIVSPVIKPVKGAKSWMGEYQGLHLIDNGLLLIENTEIVHFYMSDNSFKKDISNQEVSFKLGDIIVGDVRITGKIREDCSISNRKIWIENVSKYDDVERERFKKKVSYDTLENLPLFRKK